MSYTKLKEKTFELVCTHWLAIIFAISVGVLCVAPYFYFAHTVEYRGIAMLGQDAEEHYLARIQEAYDGNPTMGNVFLPYKKTPYLTPGLGEDIVAGLGRILHLTAAEV